MATKSKMVAPLNVELEKDEKKQDGGVQHPKYFDIEHIKYFLLLTAFLVAVTLYSVGINYHVASEEEVASEDLRIEVTSSPYNVSFYVNGVQVSTRTEPGLHVVILNQTTGQLLTTRKYNKNAIEMRRFMNRIQDGRIVLLSIKVEHQNQLGVDFRLYLKGLGSLHAEFLTADDQWAMVAQPGVAVSVLGEMVTKGSSSWSEPLKLNVTMPRMFDIPESKNTCDMLLDDGNYDTEYGDWQPKGCTMHRYNRSEAESCFKKMKDDGFNNTIAFLGDFRIRQVVQNLRDLLTDTETVIPHGVNASYENTEDALVLNYYWTTYVDTEFIEYFNQWENSTTPPRMIVASNTLWHLFVVSEDIANTSEDDYGFKNYTKALTKLVKVIKKLTERGSKVYWPMQEPIDYEQIMSTNLRHFGQNRITNNKIDMFNAATIKILQGSGAHIWRSFRLIGKYKMHEVKDGVHHGNTAKVNQFQVLLNSYCNEQMHFREDNICCINEDTLQSEATSPIIRTIWRHNNKPISTTILQKVTFTIFTICCVVAVGVLLVRLSQWVRGRTHQEDSDYTVVTSLAKMAVIMAFFWLCDMTDLFTKQQKHFSEYHFWLPLCGLLALGVFFNKKCPDEKLLNRDQTDEWKGWMQLVILVYHITGASKVLPIYLHLRAIVSAYLFLTGYGHFCYIWKDGQVTMSRYLQVMFRLNFLTVLLCCCMDQPLINYYYVPLVSFWFTVTYIFLAIPPRITITTTTQQPRNHIYLGVKFGILCAVITGLYLRRDIFNSVFDLPLWRLFFASSDSGLKEWMFRWDLDRYSALYGMIFASLYLISEKCTFTNTLNFYQNTGIYMAAMASLMGLFSFAEYSMHCEDKAKCNLLHPYISFVPIISFIVLRNVFGQIRARYSSFFAWFGRISLELFICQYHIWLANDTRSVLVIITGYPITNLLLTTAVFVFVAHEVHRCTCSLEKSFMKYFQRIASEFF